MTKEESVKKNDCKIHHSHGFVGGAYGLTFIGAAVFFIQHSDTFWMGVLGFLKAIVWPALVVFKLLGFLKI